MPGVVVSTTMQEELLRLATGISSESKGTVLFRRGDEPRGLYLICSGSVSLTLDAGIFPFPTRTLGPGAILGLPSTISGSAYSLTAEVVDNAQLAFVPRAAVLNCLATNQQLCFEVMELLSSEISGTRAVLKQASPSRQNKA